MSRTAHDAGKVRTITVTRRLRLSRKICQQCGAPFEGTAVQKHCSRRCSQILSYRRHAEARRAARRGKYHQQKAQKQTPTTPKKRAAGAPQS
jgi:tRNA(Ile2) C34 agmatinyltransferase TiaS